MNISELTEYLLLCPGPTGRTPTKEPLTFDQLNYLKLRRQTLKQYGLTLEEYVARWHAQGGRCAICGQEETAMREGTRKMLAVDHDKATGQIRGLLCYKCNVGIGLFKDNRDSLRAAIIYLDRAAAEATPVPAPQRPLDAVFERVSSRQIPIIGQVA